MATSNIVVILYVPVLHAGYLRFFEKYAQDVSILYVLDQDLIDELTFLEKELRAIEPDLMVKLINSLGLFQTVELLGKKELNAIQETKIITANEALSHRLIKKYFPTHHVTYDTIFLRWDEANILSQQVVDYKTVSTDLFDQAMIKDATIEAEQSSDWWRHVGAVIVKNGEKVLGGHNHHVPSEQMPYTDGDPRDYIQAGTQSELATAIHAEQTVITEAARRGIPLAGASIYLTVFPCPICAKLIAYSGIKKVYFVSGHASLDGERILKANSIEIILVKH